MNRQQLNLVVQGQSAESNILEKSMKTYISKCKVMTWRLKCQASKSPWTGLFK